MCIASVEGFELDGSGAAAFQKFLGSEIEKYMEQVPTIEGLRAN